MAVANPTQVEAAGGVCRLILKHRKKLRSKKLPTLRFAPADRPKRTGWRPVARRPQRPKDSQARRGSGPQGDRKTQVVRVPESA